MRCANPKCNRGIGLVSHRLGLLDKRYACSQTCRTELVADIKRARYLGWRRAVATWLAAHLLPQARDAHPLPVWVRPRSRNR
jgi:hypothetical protein